MKPKTVAFLLIAVSLAFAGAIVLSSYLLKGSAYAYHADTVTYLWIALWWIPFSYLTMKGAKVKENKEAIVS